MKIVKITKAQAAQIVGSAEELQRLVDSHADSELALLFTYAKLYRIKRGRWVRYFISGYHADGSDVDKVVIALLSGKNHLLATQTAPAA